MMRHPHTNSIKAFSRAACLTAAACFYLCFPASAADAPDDSALRTAASAGRPEDMFRLGDEYFYGTAKTRPNYTLAAYWYRQAAEKNLPQAMFNYGICLDRGLGIKQNREAAYGWYRKAADAGFAMAKFNVANILLDGIPPDKDGIGGVRPSPALGILYLRELADDKFEPAQLRLADLLLARGGDPESVARAIIILSELCEKPTPPAAALRMMADCKYGGIGMRPDVNEMFRLLQRAVKLGDAEAAGKLAFCYEFGRGTAVDAAKAAELYRLGAERGNPMCQFKFAELLLAGKFSKGEPDLAGAVRLYRSAAAANNPQALFKLGVLTLEGTGVPKDEHKAAKYFFDSAKLGYARAQYNLACIFSNGECGMDKDDAAAAFWFRQAAERGDGASARCLALRYFEGRGVDRSVTNGEKWLLRAVELGDAEAVDLARSRMLTQ